MKPDDHRTSSLAFLRFFQHESSGGIVLAISYGTIVLLPLTLLAGLGALVLAGLGRGEKAPVTTP